MKNAIKVSKLKKYFGDVRAVDGITFEVAAGEVFGFLGPNGAGKTTTQRLLTGILKPTGGTIHIMGHDLLRDRFHAKILVGVVPESANPYRDLSAWHNLMLMGRLYGLKKKKREARAEELLDFFGLLDRKTAKVKTFSKGMNQRISLAMALIHEPRLIFLDEPTSGLDVESTRLIRALIRKLHQSGTTVFLTTHNIEEADLLCHRVAIIHKGKIAAIDRPDVLRASISSTQSVEVTFNKPVPDVSVFQRLARVNAVKEQKGTVVLFTDQPGEVACRLVAFAKTDNLEILSLNTCGPRLEDVFVHLTGGGITAR